MKGLLYRESILLNEREFLKTELQSLKACQVQYFAITIAATGAVLGLAEKLSVATDSGPIYLAPLVLILPCWTIFFDKAATVTRIVGYLRILESLICGDRKYHYVGWERSLKAFRKVEHRRMKTFPADVLEALRNSFRAVRVLADFRRNHRYWAVTWLTFFWLGLCCFWLAFKYGGGATALWLALLVAFVFSTLHNADVLWCLVRGNFTYESREVLWGSLLGVKKGKQINSNGGKSGNGKTAGSEKVKSSR